MAAKRQEWQAKKQGVLATDVQKEQVESDKTEKPPDPTHEEIKEMFGFKNLRVHHSDGDDVADFGFCQVGNHTDKVPMINPTTSGVDQKYDTTTSMVADNKMKTGMKFAYILRGNKSPKSTVRVNPVIRSQNKRVPQKKQVARFTLACWGLY